MGSRIGVAGRRGVVGAAGPCVVDYIASPGGQATAALGRPPGVARTVTDCRILFAPGAGAPSTSTWMEGWAARLATLGAVTRLDYPYMAAGRRRPDPLPALVAAHRAALARLRAAGPGPIVLAGKSMGSRVGCHLALEEEVAALVCFGYPLRGASGALRDEVLLRLRTPVLFLQGTRDRLAPLDALEAVRSRMTARSALHVVEGGDHSLEVGVRALRARGETQAEVDAAILEAVGRFLGSGAP